MKKILFILLSIQFLFATQPLTSGETINGAVKQKEKQYYTITVPKNKSLHVKLTDLEADIDLYVKKGHEVRIRFNDCFSSKSNIENEECTLTNESEESTYTILVYGFKESSFNLKATIGEAEEIPTLTGDAIEDNVEHKEGKQYKIDAEKGETIAVTLFNLTADADLRVRVGRKAGLSSFDCKSTNGGTKIDECTITLEKDATIYIHVYGYKAAHYSLKALQKSASNPCISLDELKIKIKNSEDVTEINTSCITNMDYLFNFNRNFNQDISSWDVSHVTSMNHMFSSAETFNQDLSSWNTSNVENMNNMFSYALAFKGHNLSSWNVSKVFANKWFSYGDNAPKWNIEKAIVNIAKENCVNSHIETSEHICLPKKIAYVVRTENDIGSSPYREAFLYRVDTNTNNLQLIYNTHFVNGTTLSLVSLKGFPFLAISSSMRHVYIVNQKLTFRNSNGEEQKGLDLIYYSIKEIKTLENGKKLSIKHEKLDENGDEGPVLYENIYEMITPLTMKLISEEKL